MVLGLSCFGVLGRKVSESCKQQEAGHAKKQEAAKEASSLASEEDVKAVEKKRKDRGAPIVVPHFPQRSTVQSSFSLDVLVESIETFENCDHVQPDLGLVRF
ncbi:hypothetical protein PR202_gb00308 [Eleusine coracana subsp. coracana]|uniref:Uncharacterized protein n=1 Tax=Eleusine coracana subsp. coracana TaxID=191504 RepID=A0AAV5DTY8_ELECO|nr:hypothetical protein PR202_gb00308 [Eleusine coracana subsp. coracana]